MVELKEALEKEMLRVLEEMNTYTPDSDAYHNMREELSSLQKQILEIEREESKKDEVMYARAVEAKKEAKKEAEANKPKTWTRTLCDFVTLTPEKAFLVATVFTGGTQLASVIMAHFIEKRDLYGKVEANLINETARRNVTPNYSNYRNNKK